LNSALGRRGQFATPTKNSQIQGANPGLRLPAMPALTFLPEEFVQIMLAIAWESAILAASVRWLTLTRHVKSSGELQFSDDLKSDKR